MPEVGHVLGGRYRLTELVGQGGMATIYRGLDEQLGRDVAVKILRGEYGSDPAFVTRFQREAQAAARIDHPNVVGVFDYGTDDIGPYIVMELVTGGDLAAVLRERGERGPLPPTAAARIGQQIADALEAAHAQGIVHRDIKPSNVLLTSGGRVKVADFGIAQAFTDSQLTMTGLTMGSVHYFSPEQAAGDVVTTSSDVYSAGLVLFEMLTGRRPFVGDSPAAVAMARLSGGVPSPAMVRPDVPMALDAITRWALQPDPRARPSAVELSGALGRFLADPNGTSAFPALAPPPMPPAASIYAPPPPRLQGADDPGGTRWRWIVSLAGLFVLVLAGVLLFLVIASGAGPMPTPTPRPTPTPGPTPFNAPRFIGRTIDDATELADGSGLRLEVAERETDQAEPGTIVQQDPRPGVPVLPGSTVRVFVAKPPPTVPVPDLRGETETDAVAALLEVELRPGGRFEVFDGRIGVGRVLRSDPRAGTEVTPGSAVDYWVSRGPRPTPTPAPVAVDDYGCLDLASAVSRIEADGLRVGTITPAAPESDDDWLVVAQRPPAGAEVPAGARVHLELADPASPCP